MPTIIYYSTNADAGSPIVTALNNSSVIRENGVGITSFSDLAAIPVRMLYANSGKDTLILEVLDIFELGSLLQIKDYFAQVTLILILPMDNRELVSHAYQLYPRYLAYSDSKGYIDEVCGVIEKLYSTDSAISLTPAVKTHIQSSNNGGLA